jgi:predicted porin
MKKSLLAIAAMTAFAGAAQAQSSVTVYGVMDAGVASVSNGTGSTSTGVNNKVTGLQDGGLSAPRLGFMGTEDLGGGMAAKFLLESELSLRTGGDNGLSSNGAAPTSPAIFSRGAWVGLSDKTFGETRLGFQNTITYDNSVEFDALKAANMGGFAAVAAASASAATGNVYGNYLATRVNSSYAYITPVISGFSAKVVQGATQKLGPLSGNTSSTRLTEYGVRFEGMGAKVAINAGSLASSAGSDGTQAAVAGTKVVAAYGAYDFKVAEVNAARVVTTGQGTGGKDYITTGVGVRAPVTPKITVGAQYTMVDNKAITSNGGGSVIGGVAEYALSKRTTAYALAAFSNNQSGAQISMTSTSKFSAGTQVGAAGLNQTGYMIGMRHTF